MQPLVTIFVPCYNYGRYLLDCVESILRQPGVDVSVLILDDASGDNTQEVAHSLAQRDDRVQYVRHQINLGHIATFNEGIEWAHGDYTTLLSADDMLTEGALQRATTILEAHPSAVFAYGRVHKCDSGSVSPVASEIGSTEYSLHTGRDWIGEVCSHGRNPIYSPEVLVRTSAQREAGGYNARLPHTGDMEMWLRLAARGDVCVLQADQAFYRVHGANMHDSAMQSDLDIKQRRLAFEIFFADAGQTLPNLSELQALVTRAMVREEVLFASTSLDANGGRMQSLRLVGSAVSRHPLHALFSTQFGGYLGRLILGPAVYNKLRARLASCPRGSALLRR